MAWIAGVDGCRAGWVAVFLNPESGERETRICRFFEEVSGIAPAPGMTAVDMPIGLFDEGVPGGGMRDTAARVLLKKQRSSSVFPPPSRRALGGDSFEEAGRLNGAAGLTLQSYCLFPKLREVDGAMTPHLQERIREVHPFDACVACWSAERILRGEAVRIPDDPPLDARGLRMEIWG